MHNQINAANLLSWRPNHPRAWIHTIHYVIWVALNSRWQIRRTKNLSSAILSTNFSAQMCTQTTSCFLPLGDPKPKFLGRDSSSLPNKYKCLVNLTLEHAFVTFAAHANGVAWAQNPACLWGGRATPNSSQIRESRHVRNPKQHSLINTVHYSSPS